MKIITQLNLFEDQELGDLEKILAVLDGLPEGRKDYSVQSLFIACIAQMVLQLKIDAQFIRHLNMNSQLHQICGFETHGVKLKNGVVKLVHAPSTSAFHASSNS